MGYRVELRPAAQRELNRIPASDARRILSKITALAEEPFPPGVKKLAGTDWYRIRIGDYRVVYALEKERLLVLVIRIGHRREVYRSL
jgi:mRNA interferase RelE/StbE